MEPLIGDDERAFYRNRRLASAVEVIASALPAGTVISIDDGIRTYLSGPGSKYATPRLYCRSETSGRVNFASGSVPRALHYGQARYAARNAHWDQLAADVPQIVAAALKFIEELDPIRHEQMTNELKFDLGHSLDQKQLDEIWPTDAPEAVLLVERRAWLADMHMSDFAIG